MIVSVPFHTKDAEKAASMLELWSKLELVQNHQLFLIYPHNTPSQLVEKVFNAGRKAFTQVEKYAIPHDIPEGWPKGPNKMFSTAVGELRKSRAFEGPTGYRGDYRQPNGAFIWWEPDCVPLHAGCLDRLQSQYQMAGKPFLGKVVPTLRQEVLERAEPTRDQDGRPLDDGKPERLGHKFIDGEHMVLVGMYDRAMAQRINWIQQAAEGEDPVDVVLQNEICQKDGGNYTRLVNTDLIGHGWHTTNYRVVQDGEMLTVQADSDDDNTGSSVFQIHRRGYTGPCMIHGCKDNSLIELVEWIHGHRAEPPKWEATVKDVQVEMVSKSETGEAIIEIKKEPIMQSSPLNEPEHDSDDLTEDELRILAKLQAKLNRKEQKKVSKKTKGKIKKVAPPEVNDNEVWEFYVNASGKPTGNAWQETLKHFRISAVQLSRLRKERENLQPA